MSILHASRRKQISFGDFQTPQPLANEVCQLLQARGLTPNSIVEPTCGLGGFLMAAADYFPAAVQVIGYDINQDYLEAVATRLRDRSDLRRFRLEQVNIFEADWCSVLSLLPQPILVIGNPPWVTNATQGSLGSSNLPAKSNFDQRRGIEAITGNANFDVSEWILCRLFDALEGGRGTLAMLCKTAVARRVLSYAWRRKLNLSTAELHSIDARVAFGAAVNACLLITEFAPQTSCDSAKVYSAGRLSDDRRFTERIGWRDNQLVANLDRYVRHRNLGVDRPSTQTTNGSPLLWRSGVKHDCSAVMELVVRDGRWWNRLDEEVDVEPEHVFPLVKSGDIAGGRRETPRHWLLLPQRFVGEDTAQLESKAPRLWRYLQAHGTKLDARRSSIYRRQPRFAIFGIGEYSFAPWKVAVSGFSKRLHFSIVGSAKGQPWMLDDTSYFLPCQTADEANAWCELLNSQAAMEFFSAFIFWDAKRPVTAELLRRLDLERLAADSREKRDSYRSRHRSA